MAPVTRRRAKAAQEVADSTQTSPERSILSPMTETKTTIDIPAAAAGSLRRQDGESPEETPTKATSKSNTKKATPKGKKLAVRVRDEDHEDGSHHVSVEAHTVDADHSVADSQDHEQDSDDAVEEHGSSTPFTPSAMLSKQLEEEASQKLKRDRKDLKSAKEAPSPAPKAKGSHVVFGDDDDVDTYVAAAAEKEATNAKQGSEDEEESDDDEAPEAVSTSAATKAAKKTEREAAEAAEKQAADLKRKRQEKDKMMKQQAEKRKRAQSAKSAKRGAEDSDEEDFEAEKAARRPLTAQQKLDRHNLPDELPAEFLTDSDSEDDSKRKPKKIKFEDAVQSLSLEGRRPQDEVVGSTVYRVLADQGDKNQAPRMHHNARRMKEQLLRRGRAAGPTGKSKGFLKNKK
ncbi:hypothetical protein PG995_011860 [Apiospora arundinis]